MNVGLKKLMLDRGLDDIISGLPRHVLDKIFECLPVKDAAKTSILSRKWRYLWSAYPYLVFDRQFFETIIAHKPNSANKYVNMIYKALLGHDGPILNFDLYIPNLNYDWDEHIDEWLLFLSRNGIRKLNLDYQCFAPYKLPSYVFSSSKLINLKLSNILFKPPVSFSGFANLSHLHLNRITFVASAFNGASPVAPLLTMLIFNSCTGINHFNIYVPRALVIFVDYSTELTPIFFDKFPNLNSVSIIIGELLRVAYQGKGSIMNLYEFLKKFPRVEGIRLGGCYLKLSAATLIERRLSFVLHHLTTVNLCHLCFGDMNQISCAFWLLNSSPNLERFHVSVAPSKNKALESVLTHSESPDSMCKMLNLREVKLHLVEGSKPELLFIKCILANSPNLDSLHVTYGVADRDEQFKISNELMRFPRASNKAQVIYAC